MKKIEIQLAKDIARQEELTTKIILFEKEQETDWNGVRYEQILGYKEEINIININIKFYNKVLNVGEIEGKKLISLFNTNKRYIEEKLKKIIKSNQKNIARLQTIQKGTEDNNVDEPLTEEEEILYPIICDEEGIIPIYKGELRGLTFCLRELRAKYG